MIISGPLLRFFQGIFNSGPESHGRYPELLIAAAIEHAVDVTDARLRLLPGYRKRLREPVIHAIQHVSALVDNLPTPVMVERGAYCADRRLAAVFATAEDMLNQLCRDTALMAFQSRSRSPVRHVTTLLLTERIEKNILGMALVDGLLQREVSQIAVSFTGHRLLHPTASEIKTRRQLKRRAFDHLLTIARARLVERRVRRTHLTRQRDRLRHPLTTSGQGHWSLATPLTEIETITRQLHILGTGDRVLQMDLEMVANHLAQAEQQIWGETITLYLDSLNIQRDQQDPSGHPIIFQELRDSRGCHAIPLLLSLDTAYLSPKGGCTTSTHRYSF